MDDAAHLIEEIDEARRTIAAGIFVHEPLGTLPRTTITMQQLRVLMLLRVHGPLGGHQLARHLDVSMPTISGVVDRLAERGLVERRQDATDRRVRLVALSDDGLDVVVELESAGWSAGVEILKALDPEDLRALAQGLTALARAVAGSCKAHGLPAGGSAGADADA